VATLRARMPGAYYALVLSNNGAFSPASYELQAVTAPLGQAPPCSTNLPHSPGIQMSIYTGTSVITSPATLILVNKQRLDATYGIVTTTQVTNKLQALADDPGVKGVVLPVENNRQVSTAYDHWDTDNACNPNVANQVANEIKSLTDNYLNVHSGVQYLVVVGDDTIIPFRRVPDDGFVANESVYAGLAGLKPDNPTLAALEQGYILTDDFYATRMTLMWRGRQLWTPGLAIGRMVETPQEITAMIDAFLNRKGALSPTSALVTGYDFLSDSAQAISDTLGSRGLPPTTLIRDDWTAGELTNAWLGATRQDVASVNAHFDHTQAFPMTGATSVTAGDVLAATASLSGTLNVSMGCHSGFSVPDENATAGSQLDFAQALARRGGWWVGNTGFGYGMDDAVSFTERVMYLFVQELAHQANMPVGQALQQAKQRYLGGIPSGGCSTYDEKALIEATLYGLPMYRVSVPNPGAQAQSKEEALVGSLAAAQATALSVVPVSITPTLQLVTATVDADLVGNYYSVEGEIQASPGRPVQPRTSQDLPVYSGMTPHGVLFLSGSIVDVANFNPLISRPMTDTTLSEPTYDNPAWFPIKPFTVNRLGDADRLVVVPAQYRGSESSGIERLFQQMDFDVYYADEGQSDYVIPDIWKVDGQSFLGKANFQVQAADDSGIVRVLVTYSNDGLHWQSIDLAFNSLTGQWEGEVVGMSKTASYFVQAVDVAGNVSMTANKGLLFEPTLHEIYLPIVIR